jgi:hypothetical protein
VQLRHLAAVPLYNFIISKLVNGDKRLAAGPDIRRPFTVTVLGHLLQALAHVTKAYYQRIMFGAMFLVAFNEIVGNVRFAFEFQII